MDGGMESLRCLAPQWSLAGDKELLDALQMIHQRIMDKCQETNKKLDEMVTALDDASVNLQNVNNKFTALSNSQFIESRVYDDDTEITPPDTLPMEEQTQPNRDSNLDALKRSLQVLEEFHETVTILCDTDSESSEDEESLARVILKPKDLYSDRPLPHIIGSQAWKSKWHAGLLLDDSDSDSEHSKRELNVDQFSDSETETTRTPTGRDRTISSASSELHSEREASLPTAGPQPSLTQSDIASDLAKRFGTDKLPQTPEPTPEEPSDQPVRKLYKPDRPVAAQIFSDEPPPLESDQSVSSDDDIFAGINKNQPYSQSSRDHSSIADDLFGRPVFEDIAQKVNTAISKEKSPLFDEDSEADLFVDDPKQTHIQNAEKHKETSTKKPVGAMSLFGSKANAESIGAAILKRKQLKSASSSDDSDDNQTQTKQFESRNAPQTKKPEVQKVIEPTEDVAKVKNKERDIFDDLFARSEKLNSQKVKGYKEDKVEKTTEKKVDLFSDNLFDDIDDIFTSDVATVKDSNSHKEKSIFDDVDDLFSDVAVPSKSNKAEDTSINNNLIKTKEKISIFNSHEDLFSETKNPNTVKTDKVVGIAKESHQNKGLFDDVGDDDLFSDVKAIETKPNKDSVIKDNNNKEIDDPIFSEDDNNLFTNKNQRNKPDIEENKPTLVINENQAETNKKSSVVKSPELFDGDDDLFTNNSREKIEKDPKVNKNNVKTEQSSNKSTFVTSPDIFGEDDDLFLSIPNESKAKTDQSPKEQEFIKSNKNNAGNQNKVNEKNEVKTKTIPKISTKSNNLRPEIASKPVVPVKDKNLFKDVLENEPISKSTDITSKVASTKVTTTESITKTKSNTDFTVENSEFKPDMHQQVITTVTHIEQTVVDSVTPNVIAKKVTSIEQTVTKEDVPDTVKALHDLPVEDLTENIQKLIDNTSLKMPESIHKEKEVVKTEEKDIFSDIFDDQPPVFEKPKEPKKSKNVNALFDDDSDDEALFFRKTDVTLDDKPEVFSSPTEDRLFGLFRDEPPPDVDFIQKSMKKDSDTQSKTSDDFSYKDNTEDYFKQKPSNEIVEFEQNVSSKQDDNVLRKSSNDSVDNRSISSETEIKIEFPSQNVTESSKLMSKNSDSDNKEVINRSDILNDTTTDKIFEKPLNSKSIFDDYANKDDIETFDDDLFKPKSNTESQKLIKDDLRSEIDGTEIKKIGRLKPMNFNINVNTLLPGASPKKVNKDVVQTDGQGTSSKSSEELRTKDPVEILGNKMVKSISFEDKPDSVTLDNKLSKDRAKIQVKRRPSTRRARREAVKKSVIDLGEDTTDNSSSIDDPPPKVSSKSVQSEPKSELDTVKMDSDALKDAHVKLYDSYEDLTKTEDVKTKIDDEILKPDDFDDLFNPKNNVEINIIDDDDLFRPKDIKVARNNSEVKQQEVKDVENTDITYLKSETSDTIESTPEMDESGIVNKNTTDIKSKVVYVLHDEDIFNNLNYEKLSDEQLFKTNKDSGVNTLGHVYRDITQKNDKETTKYEDLNKTCETKTETPNVERKNPKIQSIFDSDDDTELFTSKKAEKTSKNALFASDSDEELFGKKQKKTTEKASKETEKSKDNVVKEIKKVEVKTSLFGDEDDDDELFGVKAKKTEPKMQASQSNTTKDASKSTEPVFEDPLSLLGSDGDDEFSI